MQQKTKIGLVLRNTTPWLQMDACLNTWKQFADERRAVRLIASWICAPGVHDRNGAGPYFSAMPNWVSRKAKSKATSVNRSYRPDEPHRPLALLAFGTRPCGSASRERSL